jgi:isopenicillin N synthase-like dioxygenase
MPPIPIIDLSLFINGDTTTRQTIVKQIYQACHEIGFMYLQNPGISPKLIEQVFTQSKHFFNLPLVVKQQLAWSDKFSNIGYVGIERERLNPNHPGDLKEAFNISGEQRNIGYNGYKPVTVLPVLPMFYDACTELANRVLQALALALELPFDFFLRNHNQKHHTLRLLHYPPLQVSPQPEQLRAGEHSDYGTITLLYQEEIGGLEVQTAAGDWISAPAIPASILVNTGDLMQRWTNNTFCSTKHRVMVPSDEKVKRSRHSIAFFCHPNHDTEITCLDTCQNLHPPIYPPVIAYEYLLSRLQATY